MAKPGNLIKIPISFDAAITAALKVKPEPKAKPPKKVAVKKATGRSVR